MLIPITTKLTSNVERAVDAFFEVIERKLILTPTMLGAIKEIDKATPIAQSDLTLFKTPFGIARLSDLSTGVKSVLIVLYRLEHLDATWIPSIDSMGANAKEVLFKSLEIKDLAVLPFPLYCTADDLPLSFCSQPIFLAEHSRIPSCLSDILQDKE